MYVEVYAWHWAQQVAFDRPEEYGTNTTLVNTLTGHRLIRCEVVQPQGWWDDGVWTPAYTQVYYLDGGHE